MGFATVSFSSHYLQTLIIFSYFSLYVWIWLHLLVIYHNAKYVHCIISKFVQLWGRKFLFERSKNLSNWNDHILIKFIWDQCENIIFQLKQLIKYRLTYLHVKKVKTAFYFLGRIKISDVDTFTVFP